MHDEALGVEKRNVGDGTLQICSLNDIGSKRIAEALKAMYGRRWGETERLEDCGDGRLVWVIEDEDKSAFEQALARPAGQTATTAAHRTVRRGEQMSRAHKTAARIAAADPTRDAADIPARLEYLRGELRAERISYGELAELQSLSAHIDPADVELLEAAGVPEHEATRGTAARIAAKPRTEPADPARDAEYAKAAQDAEGEPSMKTFTIEVSGATQSDVEIAIDEVKRLVSEGYQSGSNENDTGSFSFDSSGEYSGHSDEDEDEKDEEDGPFPCPSCGAPLPAVTFRRDTECPECGGSLYPDKQARKTATKIADAPRASRLSRVKRSIKSAAATAIDALRLLVDACEWDDVQEVGGEPMEHALTVAKGILDNQSKGTPDGGRGGNDDLTTCPSCGAALPAGDVKCLECGSAVDRPGAEWGGRECYACNTRLYGDEMTCPDCGAEQKPLPGGPPGSP